MCDADPRCPYDHVFDHHGSFSCNVCQHRYRSLPGPEVKCPKCRAIYATWLDYERFEKEKTRLDAPSNRG